MSTRPRRNERGLVMPPGTRSMPRTKTDRRKRERAPEPPDVPPVVAKAAGDLVAIAAAIRVCDVCSPRSAAVAVGSGYPRAPVMLVAERPTTADLEAGFVFVEEGEALDKAFAGLGMSLSSVYGTTAARSASGPACPDHLLAEIEAVEPSVLVAFGPRAVEAIRTLHGRCGLLVGEQVPQGEAIAIRPGLHLIATEPLQHGLTQKDGKRRLWRDLRQIPALVDAPR